MTSQEKGPNHLTQYSWNENLLECRSENGVLLRVQLLTDDIIRIRYATEGYFLSDFSYAIVPGFTEHVIKGELHENANQLILKTSTLQCKVRKRDLQVSFFDSDGLILNEDEKGFHWEHSATTGNDIVKMSKHVQKDEVYFGLGDKPTQMNIRGKRFENWGTDCYGYDLGWDPLYKNIPFYYGLHHDQGYGIFFDNSFRTYFDFGKERPNASSYWSHGGEMNYYFIGGPNLTDVTVRYSQLTGTADMPALWSLGFQQCKWSYYPESEVREVTTKMREHRIPCDSIYLDIDYMDGFRCFTWDTEKFPAPKQMIDDLKDQGFKTVVIIDPGIKKDPEYWVFQEGIANDYFCKRPDGPYVEGLVWPGECYFPDFTRPDVREWWADLYKELIGDLGVAGVWNDMNEPALFEVDSKTFPEDVRHDYDGHPCSHTKAHNVYGMQMARATYEGVKKHGDNKRGLVITRSGYSGLQRFSSVWTGDNIATWQHIWLANVQCQRLAISGVSYAGSDIGGFIGQPTPEMFVRWIQLGIFHPFCRVHSSQDDGDQEPWSFGTEALDLFREAIELRYQMLPYHYTAFFQYHKYGVPILRPLVFYDQTDPASYYRDHEFLCGEHILTACIDEEGATSKELYLPKGTWYDYWKNEKLDGYAKYEVGIQDRTFPFFIKAGAVLPFYPVQQYVGEKEIDEVELKVYYTDSQEVSHLYEDDHDGYQYEDGAYRYSTFTNIGGERSLKITHSFEGDYDVKYNFKLTLIGLPFVPTKLFVDGDQRDINNLIINSNFSEIWIEG